MREYLDKFKDQEPMLRQEPLEAISIFKIKSLISKFMDCRAFMEMHCKHLSSKYSRDRNMCIMNAIQFHSLIFKYKKEKKCKTNLDKKAFIDLSNCLKTSEGKLIKVEKPFDIFQNKEKTVIKNYFCGKICIPFSNCAVFSYTDDLSQLVEIKDNLDGTYQGNVYFNLLFGTLLQASFFIKPENEKWLVEVTINHKQKPLGRILTNIAVLLNYVATKPEKFFEEYNINPSDFLKELPKSLATGLLCILQYLEMYKEKTIYNSGIVYVYGDDAEDYLKEVYSGYNFKKLNGWLVNGYWKHIKGVGKDSNGKPIKNLDWIIPYGNIKYEKFVSNGQETRLIPIHAIDRLEQRYNINLSQEDLEHIKDQCLKGKCKRLTVKDRIGRIQQIKGKSGCYRINYKNKTLDFVLSRYGENYRIATFLPEPKDPDYLIIDSKVYDEFLRSINV